MILLYISLLPSLNVFFSYLQSPYRPRSVTAKTGELYEELKMNGFSWFESISSSDIDLENNQTETTESYSAVIDNDADIRKRVQRNTAFGLP